MTAHNDRSCCTLKKRLLYFNWPLHLTVTWCKIHHAGEKAAYWDTHKKKRKEVKSVILHLIVLHNTRAKKIIAATYEES